MHIPFYNRKPLANQIIIRANVLNVPFHRYSFDEAEYDAVRAVMESGWLTTGPQAARFEDIFALYKKATAAVSVSSCTAALDLLLASLPLEAGDEIITTSYTFVATAQAIVRRGAKLVLADIDLQTLNISPKEIERKITPKTRGIIAVHIAGNACAMDEILILVKKYNLWLIEDCAHAIETTYKGKAAGTFGYGGAFSFYATKNITTGEGGMITVNDAALGERLKRLRTHGLSHSALERDSDGAFSPYDVAEPGLKCNMTEIAAALGVVQMEKLASFYARRKAIYEIYDGYFKDNEFVKLVQMTQNSEHALHLYIVLLNVEKLKLNRNQIADELSKFGIQTSVHYAPVHLFTHYRQTYGYKVGDFPQAEFAGERVLSLPFYPALTDETVRYVAETLLAILEKIKNKICFVPKERNILRTFFSRSFCFRKRLRI